MKSLLTPWGPIRYRAGRHMIKRVRTSDVPPWVSLWCEPNRAPEVACTYWLSARGRLRALRKGPIGKEAFLEVTPITSRARVAWLDPPGGRESRTKCPQDCSAPTSDVRGLHGRPRRPPIRGHTSSVPRHGLRGVGCLKQLPKPVFQQFDGLPQGAELRNPDYRDGSVQVTRW